MNEVFSILNKYFGYNSFREGQLEIINNIVKGKDSFCIMPTGGGKSLCYQIPAMLFKGVTIVISPLISLMKDQVDTLNILGINAAYISSMQTNEEIKKIIGMCYKGEIKLLYIAPERLEYAGFISAIKKIQIAQVAVDEAHCVSMWGHDFRKSYRSIAPFIKSLHKRPVITTFTATATKEVKQDIINLLELKDEFTYVGSFDRDNLEITIKKEEDKVEFVKDIIKENIEDSGIIYCATRKEVDGLYDYLRELDFSVAKYHGGLKDEEKNYFQEEFLKDNTNVIIATNAFGMGIDKSNIRYIIHFTMPKSIEAYYQEIGRGGRDGEKTKCYLLYSRIDIKLLEYIINSTIGFDRREFELKKLQNIIDFCEYDKCYRSYILNYFGEAEVRDYCNNCSNCFKNDDLIDFTIEAQKILSCIYRTREKFGESVIVDILKGFTGDKIKDFKLDKLSTYGIMKSYSPKLIKDIIHELINQQYMERKSGTYSMVKLNNKSYNILKGKEKVLIRLDNNIKICNDEELFKKLRILRKDLARRDNVKPYIVFSDSILIDIANEKPKNKEELLKIRGMGEKKIQKYGAFLLTLLRDYEKTKFYSVKRDL